MLFAKVKPRLDFEDSGKAKAGQVVERNFIDASRKPCGRGSDNSQARKRSGTTAIGKKNWVFIGEAEAGQRYQLTPECAERIPSRSPYHFKKQLTFFYYL